MVLCSPIELSRRRKKSYFICIRHIYFLRCFWNTRLLSSIGTISVTVWVLSFSCFSWHNPQGSQCFAGCRPTEKHTFSGIPWTDTKTLFFPSSFKQHCHIDFSPGTIEIPHFMAVSTLTKTDKQKKLLSSCEIIICSLISKFCFQEHVMLVGNSSCLCQ